MAASQPLTSLPPGSGAKVTEIKIRRNEPRAFDGNGIAGRHARRTGSLCAAR